MKHNVVLRNGYVVVLGARETELVYALWEHGPLDSKQLALKVFGSSLMAQNGHELSDPEQAIRSIAHTARGKLAELHVKISGEAHRGFTLVLAEWPAAT